MTYKHTQGPWHYDWTTKTNGVAQGWSVGPADKPLDQMDHIDPVLTIENDCEEAEANAQLIAAAPELLEALEEFYNDVVKEVCSQGDGFTEEGLLHLKVFQKAKSVIEKAGGGND